MRLFRRQEEMLSNVAAVATVGVKDIKRAAEFYENTLGLERVESMGDGAAAYRTGSSSLFVYESQFAGSNKATAVTWDVGNEVDRIVQELKRKGVQFEHYNLPGTKRDGDIHVAGDQRLAWLKDPDGNILAIAGR
jgi:catechol 2,3-dioxygenase-like lactoylglutathione lyase family enzyme